MKISVKILLFIIGHLIILAFVSLKFYDLKLLLILYLFYFLLLYPIFIIYSRAKKRLRNVAFKLEEMTAGNIFKKIESTEKDEVGQVTNALNNFIVNFKTKAAQDVTMDKELDKAKNDFVSLASHQLRTPLSIIKWYLDFIISGDAGNLQGEQEKYLKETYKANERLIELVNNLLDVSRIDLGTFAIEPEPSDLVGIAEEVIDSYKKIIKDKELEIDKRYEDIPVISLDRRLIKLVFENLYTNAFKYTPKKGKVRITIKNAEGNVIIKIADNGCGIPKEQQPKIFTKLFRADNVRRMESVGTGLGLYIVKSIVETAGGKIWFESPSMELFIDNEKKHKKTKADKNALGTTFFITIPLQGMKPKAGSKKLTS